MQTESQLSEPKQGTSTLRDIADRLGISVATASRALRKVPGISAQTRSRVLQAAAELNYSFRGSYRNAELNPGKLHHVAILVETRNTHVPPPYLTGLSDASMDFNVSLVFHYVRPGDCESILDPKSQPRAMRSGLLSGAILIYPWPGHVVKRLSEILPIVSIVHQYPESNIDVVGLNNLAGINLLVRRLHEHGHRQIGFLGRNGQVDWANSRFGGYVASLTALGLGFREDLVVDGRFEDLTNFESNWAASRPQVERMIHEGVRAWVSVSEPAGWNLYKWVQEMGLRVPEDVSITGFHRPSHYHTEIPNLTSVQTSHDAIGAAALRRLLYRAQNPAEIARTILFPCTLYPGETVGPALN